MRTDARGRMINASVLVLLLGLCWGLQPVHRVSAMSIDDCEKLNAGSCDFSCDPSAGEQEIGMCDPEYPLHPIGGVCCTHQKLEPGHSAKTSDNPTGVAPTSATGAAPGVTGSTVKLFDPLGGAGLVGVISRLISTFLGVVGAIALLVFVYAGVTYMTAGSSDRVKKAIEAMKYAALGLFIIMFAYMISSLYLSAITSLPASQQAAPKSVALPQAPPTP